MFTLRTQLFVLAAAAGGCAVVSAAHAGDYSIGQRVECDGTELKTYYKPGTVIAFQPGDMFNGNGPETGYFYRVRFDDGDADGRLCRAEDMLPLAATPAPPAPPAPPPVPVTNPVTPPTVVPPPPPPAVPTVAKRAVMDCPRQAPATGGAPSLGLAEALVKCQWEGESDNIYTINFDWQSASVGASRPWKETWSGRDMGTGVPGETRVWPVTGTWTTRTYSSSGVVTVTYRGTHNCYINAQRVWQCGLGDSTELSRSEVEAP